MKNIVFFTGAGISAESGIQTFRGAGGLWEGTPVREVASPEGWFKDRARVLEFYNQRRAAVIAARPNAAHDAIADLERDFKVTVITQNIDDLHERAGSSHVIHLHGEITKGRSSNNPNIVFPLNSSRIEVGDKAPDGSQVRPHVVWFGEPVLRLDVAKCARINADIVVVCGTSLDVQPAAGLIDTVRTGKVFLVDPNPPDVRPDWEWTIIAEPATTGIPRVAEIIRSL